MSDRIMMRKGTDSQPLSLGSGRGLLSHSHGKAWGGPPVELHEYGGFDANAGTTSGPPKGQLGVMLILSGQTDATMNTRRGIIRRRHRPGTLVLLSGDAPPEIIRTEGLSQALVIALPDGWRPEHGGLLGRDWRELTTSLPPDRAALSLGLAIRSELAHGAERGPLYSEALSLSLLNLTQSREDSDRLTPRLTLKDCELVRDYVENHLDGAISIEDLAALVGLRRRQFSECFRASFGLSAYHYVLQRRVARGAVMLARGCSIAEAALAAGFCSQSHFTVAYRRQLGVTPSAGQRR